MQRQIGVIPRIFPALVALVSVGTIRAVNVIVSFTLIFKICGTPHFMKATLALAEQRCKGRPCPEAL
ncbi:MAG: hypothetical protein KA795_00300 [Burkholderiaceae bacterium]|nr:hypothetical protein [Burkholderiaceae bacterium]